MTAVSAELPGTAAAALALVRQSSSVATLGDGSVRHFNVYAAEVEWDGVWRPVLESAVGNEVLVGMRLLAGHELRVAVIPGGPIEEHKAPGEIVVHCLEGKIAFTAMGKTQELSAGQLLYLSAKLLARSNVSKMRLCC